VFVLGSRKTDQYRDGSSTPIARTGKVNCPVNMLQKYCTLACIDLSSDRFLFRSITRTKSGSKLSTSGRPSYNTAGELDLDMQKTVVNDVSCLGLHSLLSEGFPDRLYNRYGRWIIEGEVGCFIWR